MQSGLLARSPLPPAFATLRWHFCQSAREKSAPVIMNATDTAEDAMHVATRFVEEQNANSRSGRVKGKMERVRELLWKLECSS
jgi:hypothetical protein